MRVCFAIGAGVVAALGAARTAANEPPRATRVTLGAVGDVMFGRYGASGAYEPVTARADPFDEIAPALRSADLSFCNLETPLADEGPSRANFGGAPVFRAAPEAAMLLAGAGFDVVSLANNHAHNLGLAAAVATRARLTAANLAVIGAGANRSEAERPELRIVRGVRVAFLGFTVWSNGRPAVGPTGAIAWVDERRLARDAVAAVRGARESLQPDFVVVSLHWGDEYAVEPRGSQREAARALVAAGADLILGHHPHVLGPVERHGGAVVAYSLGNFLFDQPQLDRRQSVILRATLVGRGAGRRVDAELVPVLIDPNVRIPGLARAAAWRALRDRLARLAPGFDVAADPGPR